MTTTANSKGLRTSIPGLCFKWFFGGIRIYNAEKTHMSSMRENYDSGKGTLASFRVLGSYASSWYMTIHFAKDIA